MATDIERLETKIRQEYEKVEVIHHTVAVENFLSGSVYYSEFKSKDDDDSFCYAFVAPTRIELFDDGVDLIKALQQTLERRRTFLQRVSEFTVPEMIGGFIAVVITLTLAVAVLFKIELNKEFFGVFGIIAGYYFGKNVRLQ